METGWATPLDNYCERMGPGLLAEPLNAVSNASFFLAALYGFALWRRSGDRGVLLLAVIAVMVGTGSTLFHTLATRWAALADVIPIGIFIAVGFYLVMNRLLGLRTPWAAAATVVFFAISPLVSTAVAPVVGSSAGYVPTLAALLGVGAFLRWTGRPGGAFVLATGLVFLVSLGMRIADLPACGALPIGTHFLWHLLNGLVLALVMRSVAKNPG